MSNSWRQYGIQVYGFLVKTFLQRWRTPVSTLAEVFLPCLFVVLLSIAFWLSGDSVTAAQMYDGGNQSPSNMSHHASSFFCKMPQSTLGVRWRGCNVSEGIENFKCLSLIGSGNDVCISMGRYFPLSRALNGMYWGSDSFVINTMDTHLAMSALVTEVSRRDNPTFFGRGGKASLSHYGRLLVSSDLPADAEAFMDFCRTKSGMCGEVLHPKSFSSLDMAQDYAAAHENTVWAIVHLPKDAPISSSSDGVTEFTISMNFSATASTSSGSPKSLFSRGLAKDGSRADVLYWSSGFLTLQTFVQEFYLDKLLASSTLDGPATYNTDTTTGREGISAYLSQYGSVIMSMPTPEVYNNPFLTNWAYYMPLLAVMAVLYPTSRLVLLIVDEKHNGIREAMLIMGLNPSCMFFGWYASTLITDIVSSLLAAMFLKIGFMGRVDYSLLVLMYFTFMQQNTALCFFVSSLFHNPRVASWFIAFMLFVCAVPSFSFPDGMRDIQKILCCLVPCVGYSEAFKMMLSYVSLGWGFGWREAQAGYFNFSIVVGMMWSSFAMLMLLAFYLDRVSFGAVGQRAHPLFFLMPLVRLFRKRKVPMIKMSDMGRPLHPDSIVQSTSSDDGNQCSGSSVTNPLKSGEKGLLQNDAEFIEHYHDVVDPLDPANAAVFHRLRKVYVSGGFLGFFYTYFTGLFRKGDRVVALDGVTFAMRTGEVSVLLGPNGAGKSTIMGLVTGMVSPTSGDVYVRGYNGGTHIDECRQNVGYCPQRDIVWSLLTVEEHITFYARMKGSDSVNVQTKVADALALVDLHEKRHCKACNLSAGQRRRLCVAIAMVGDSSVLFLDEPTAGMDIQNRKAVYDALNRSRANRSVLISTHLLDDADRIADRVLIVNNGVLCAEGSTMFLKSKMNVGYVVTCLLKGGMSVVQENNAATNLMNFVRAESYAAQRVGSNDGEGCVMVGTRRRGREVCFRFPLNFLSSAGVALISAVERNSELLHVESVSLDLTTLEDVFFTMTHTTPLVTNMTDGEPVGGWENDSEVLVDGKKSPTNTNLYHEGSNGSLFCRHFYALFMKRVHYAQRDVRLLIYQVVLPIIFLVLSLLINLVRNPSQPALRLDMTMYNDYTSNPSQVVTGYSASIPSTNSTPAVDNNAFALGADLPSDVWGPHYLTDFREIPTGLNNLSYTMSQLLQQELWNHTSPRYIAIAPVGFFSRPSRPTGDSGSRPTGDSGSRPTGASGSRPTGASGSRPTGASGSRPAWTMSSHPDAASGSRPTGASGSPEPPFPFLKAPTVLHNSSNPHAAPQGVDALYHLARRQLVGGPVQQPTVVNSPMKLGAFEKGLVETSKQVMVGIFIILPFIFIPSNTIAYIVEEKESGSRHMQRLSGASMLAYWLSSFVFDCLCYLATQILAFVIFALFDRTEYIGRETIGPAIVLFLFFGVSSIPVSYLLSFFFRSGFTAQSVVFCINFTFGFLWVTAESMISEHALGFVKVMASILRIFPSVCFGEGMYVLSGTQLANMMFPNRKNESLFSQLYFTSKGKPTGGIGTGLIYMSVVGVVCTVALVLLEYLDVKWIIASFRRLFTILNPNELEDYVCLRNGDPSVEREESRVCSVVTGPPSTGIAVQYLHKRYPNTKDAAVCYISFGVDEGEVVGMLGLNGAGKSTVLSILAGETVATDGEAYVNHYSVESRLSRRLVGYCPQYDALLSNLSTKEHLWLYARLRGIKKEHIGAEVQFLLRELGLYPFRHQAAGSLSGGNKRRLSLAIALVGHTTSVLLDEPTAGMDAVGRAQTCSVVRRLCAGKSVLLSTHILDEVDALADRVAFVVRGNLRCIGTPRELRMSYNSTSAYTLHVVFFTDVRLQGTDVDLVETVRQYVFDTIMAASSEKNMQNGARCDVLEVHPCSMQLSVNGNLSSICRVACEMQAGRVKGIPPTAYTSVSKPTLEDILLLQ